MCKRIYIYSYTYRYISSRRGTYGGTVRKEEKNGERETRLTQGGFWLIGQTYKFVATYPWITWGPSTLVGPRTSVPFLRQNATHRGTRPRSYLRHRPEASFLTADRTRATRAYAMRLVQPPLLSFFLTRLFIFLLASCARLRARGYYCPPPTLPPGVWKGFVSRWVNFRDALSQRKLTVSGKKFGEIVSL